MSSSVFLSPRYALTTVHDEPTGVEHVNVTANVAYQLVKQRGDAEGHEYAVIGTNHQPSQASADRGGNGILSSHHPCNDISVVPLPAQPLSYCSGGAGEPVYEHIGGDM